MKLSCTVPVSGNATGLASCSPAGSGSSNVPGETRPATVNVGITSGLMTELHESEAGGELALSAKLTANENGPYVSGVREFARAVVAPTVLLSASQEGAVRLQEYGC